ncbi:ABC transporter permease [Paracoccus sp. NFXS7]|uniref:ABC transporter permease n=1 Tax=Paracoccus sp. NFXS7 TaxID=2908653 RepID=UPI0032DE4EA5
MTELRLGRTYWFLQNIQAVAGGIVALVAAHWLAPTAAPLVAVWLIAWLFNAWLAGFDTPATRAVVPIIFGGTIILLWEMAVRAYAIPTVILPAPSQIAASFAANTGILWADFVQTILKGALTGWLIGAAAAVLTAIAIDRSPFLQRGLLPIGNFVAALPIVGIAPILVMWFGFDWQSKAAVVVVMVFFPILVNMVAGLRATDAMQRDLMASWAAPYGAALWKLRLPAAMPFLFNGLKITTTLALIGAIVAEFFGSPTRGMGFRISTAVGRLDLPLVWAEIVVAALAGTLFYGIVALIEKKVTFWHPSQRN